MCAVGLDRTDALALEAGVAEQAAQPRQRVLHHACAGALERVVAFEHPQVPARGQRVPCLGEQARQGGTCGRMIEQHQAESRAGACEVVLVRAGSIARLQDAAGEPAPLGVGAGALRRAARMRERGAGVSGAGSGLEQLGMIDPDQQHRALRLAQARRTQQLGQRATEARLGTACVRERAGVRCGAIAQQQRVAPIDLRQEAAHETRGLRARAHAVVHPLPLAQPLDETGLAQDLEMARHARLTLLQRPRQVRDAERALGTESEQTQPAGLTRRAEPLHELRRGNGVHSRIVQIFNS